MSSIKRVIHCGVLFYLGLAGCVLCSGCQKKMTNSHDSTTARRDINDVLSDHDDALLSIPGVVGVYVGLMEDGQTPCLKVMLAKEDPSLDRVIPETIEGYKVIKEVSGEIRPLNDQ